jgi:hypothetical protein
MSVPLGRCLKSIQIKKMTPYDEFMLLGLLRTAANVRYWQIADIPLAATNVGFGGNSDITVDGPECPLMTQSGH